MMLVGEKHFLVRMSGLQRLRHLQVGDMASSASEMGDMAEDFWQSLRSAIWSDNSFKSWATNNHFFGRGSGGLDHSCPQPKPSYLQCMEEGLESLEQLIIAVRIRNEDPAQAPQRQYQICEQTHEQGLRTCHRNTAPVAATTDRS